MFFRFFNAINNNVERALKRLELGRITIISHFEQRLTELENKYVNMEEKINALEKEIQEHKAKHQGLINLMKFSLGRYDFLEDDSSASEPSGYKMKSFSVIHLGADTNVNLVALLRNANREFQVNTNYSSSVAYTGKATLEEI